MTLGWAAVTILITSSSRTRTTPWILWSLAILSYFSTANSPALCIN